MKQLNKRMKGSDQFWNTEDCAKAICPDDETEQKALAERWKTLLWKGKTQELVKPLTMHVLGGVVVIHDSRMAGKAILAHLVQQIVSVLSPIC
jgi:hypothetical protein